jgi:hypothetical protein
MSEAVWTKAGLVDGDLLEVTDTVSEGHNHRKISTQWRLKAEYLVGADAPQHAGEALPAGELMREDCAASVLRGPGMDGVQGQLS